MNSYRALITILVLCSPSLFSMEEQKKARLQVLLEEPKKPTLRILNKTSDKIEVIYSLAEDINDKKNKYRHITLIPNQNTYLIGQLKTLKDLYVAPYGQYKGLIDAPTLTVGLLKRTNVLDTLPEIKKTLKERKNIAIKIVQSGWFGKILPYDYKIIPFEEEEKPALLLFDFFPQVKNAWKKKKKIEPRYFLNIGKFSSEKDMENAHLLQSEY